MVEHAQDQHSSDEIRDLASLTKLLTTPEEPEQLQGFQSKIRQEEAMAMRSREKRDMLTDAGVKTAVALGKEEACLDPNQESIRVLKTQQQRITELAERVLGDSEFHQTSFADACANAYIEAKVTALQATLVDVSLDLGFLYGRDNAEQHIANLRTLRGAFLTTHQSFLTSVEGLDTAVKETIDESERLGMNIRVKVEKVSGMLHNAAVGMGGGILNDYDSFCTILRTLSPHERTLLHVVFEEQSQFKNELPGMLRSVWDTIRGKESEKPNSDESKTLLLKEEDSGTALDTVVQRYFGVGFLSKIMPGEKSEVLKQVRLEQAVALIEGDSMQAGAARLFDILHSGWGQRAKDLEAAMLSYTVEERKEIERIYNEDYAGRLDERELTLHEKLASRNCNELVVGRLCAILEGDQAKADAFKVKEVASKYGRIEELYGLLHTRSDEELSELASAYDELFYSPDEGYRYRFKAYLKTFVPYCIEKERILLSADGDQYGAEAALIREGIAKWDGDKIAIPFYKEDEEYRTKVLEAFERVEGRTLESAIQSISISDVDRHIIRSVMETGELCQAALIRHALELKKPDVDAVKTILEDASDEELQEIARRYDEDYDDIKWSVHDRLVGMGRYLRDSIIPALGNASRKAKFIERLMNLTGISSLVEKEEKDEEDRGRITEGDFDALIEDINQKFTGLDLFDAEQAMHGVARTGEEVLERVTAALQKEQAGILVPWLLSRITRAGKIMRRDVQRIKKVYEDEYVPLKEAGKDTSDVLKHLNTLFRIARVNTKGFRTSKERLADEASNWGSGFALVAAVSMATAASAPFWLVPTIAGVASMGSRTLLKALFKGHSYNPREFMYDLAYAVIDGAMLASGSLLRRLVRQKGLMRIAVRAMAKVGLKQMVNFSKKRMESIKSDKVGDKELNPEAAKDVLTELALSLLRR